MHLFQNYGKNITYVDKALLFDEKKILLKLWNGLNSVTWNLFRRKQSFVAGLLNLNADIHTQMGLNTLSARIRLSHKKKTKNPQNPFPLMFIPDNKCLN